MSFFRRLWNRTRNGGYGDNGGHKEEPADNERRLSHEQEEVSSEESFEPHQLDLETVFERSWTMGRGVIRDAQDFNTLLSMNPEGVIRICPGGIMALLKETAVEVGTVQSTDTIVHAAFGHRHILTKGSAEAADDIYETTWTSILNERANQSDPIRLGGWKERATLNAYRLSIKNAAAPLGVGILTPLLRREENGVPTDKVWEFLSVRAIVQHKWDLWASKCLFWESILFMGWLFSFVCFLLVYISNDISEDYDTMDPEERGAAFMAYIADASSVVFMSPFLVKAFNAVVYYGLGRLQIWNVIDVCCYILQLVISVFHYYHFFFRENIYTSLLAVHCVLLFVKVQYYCKVMEVGAAYIESLKILIISVRGLLLFILLAAFSAALSFATLYKWDIRNSANESNEELEGFSSFPRAIITTFSVLLGNFEPAYVFDTKNKIVKGIFFIVFEAIISIAVLNLMTAVMTQSYAWTISRGLALHNRCRAETIDRLEVTLPRFLYHKYEPYIYFLVREEEDQIGSLFTHRGLFANTMPARELQRQMEDMKDLMKELNEKMDHLAGRMNDLAARSSPSFQAHL